MMSAYGKLLKRSREVSAVSSTSAILQWDQETMMPPQGAEYRSEQLSYLAGLAHRLWTSKETGDWLAEAESAVAREGGDEAVNLREWRRSYDRATKLSPELVEACARTESQAHHAWVEARKKNDFSLFRDLLGRLVEQARQKADCWGYETCRYDALLEGYEPGAKSEELAALFNKLAVEAASLIPAAEEASRKRADGLPSGPYPIEAQQKFNRMVAEAVGFDFEAGRIDTATHPFCTGLGPRDCRMTTRYDEDDFTSSLYGVMHETGHGLYDQGLPAEHYGTPLGDAVSLAIHESQSRLWENYVGRSRAFWEFWFGKAVECFPPLKGSSPEKLWAHVNRVKRSFIRVEADEVTYDLHIILRFRMEKALLEGGLEVAGLPSAWNSEFEKLFGLKVPNDAQGCLQDIHWSMGGFGYFPTYTLGNLNAAQLFNAARRENPELARGEASGEYGGLLTFLRTRIHAEGKRFLPGELIRRATGKNLDTADYLKHLSGKMA